ncbi:MAG: hypothetical protein ACTH0C_07440 [Actinomycetaceae bacterium]
MGSAFFPPGDEPPGLYKDFRVAWHLHPLLTRILNDLEGPDLGDEFRARAVDVSTLKVLNDPVDHAGALGAHLWLLEHADGSGLPLTEDGYLSPADARALAEVLPTMDGWREISTDQDTTYEAHSFHQSVERSGLLETIEGRLHLTQAGQDGLASPTALWDHLAHTLVPGEHSFTADASVVILVHAATSEGAIENSTIAETLFELGWEQSDGSPIEHIDVYLQWNELWTLLGNVGMPRSGDGRDEKIGPEARVLVNQALFTEVPPNDAK